MANRSLLSKIILFLILTISYSAARGQGTLTVYFSPPAAQSTTVTGVSTETFDNLSTGVKTAAYTSTAGIGTYTGSSTNPFAIVAHGEFGGATDSTHSSPTNYLGLGSATNSTSPVILTLTHPAAYFGFWWSAGDQFNRVDLYQGSTLFATFTTQNLLTFLNNGVGTVTAINGTTTYNTSAYFGNPNITSGANDSAEPFVYISFQITGATIDKLAFYNTSATGSTFESDNHSVIFSGSSVTIPTTFVQVETLSLTPTAATPTFSPVAGTYTSAQTVTISTVTSGTSIRYTTNGSTPSETAGTLYSGTVTVGATQTLNAIAYGTGLADSAIGSAAYTINLPVVATPTFSPVAGTYTSAQTVTIATMTSGASIRYTTDGSTPSETAGTLYSGSVTVGATETLEAIAYKTGMIDSAVASAAYTINLPVVVTPTFSPVAGTYTSAQTVTIRTTTSGASIRYTTDGSTPSETAGTLYSGTVTVGSTETLKAIAYKTGMTDSAVVSAAYTINLPVVVTPTFSPVAGTYTSVQTVTISTTTSGASIRYTTDGSTPSETAGALYSGTVTVGTTETLKAIAYKTGMSDSAVASALYTINLPVVVTPTFSPVAGTYTSAQTVTISTTTSGASIRYTTDGTTPSETAGTLYSGTVTVGVTETLRAIAYKIGMTDSAVASALYTINLPVATPTFSPVAGTYTSAQTVTISTTTSGASIRYTTDGSSPSETAGTLYSGTVTVGITETLKAIAYETGMTDSAVGSALYTINLPVVVTPTFSPVAGTYISVQTITISTTTSGASIRYTTDGSTPTETAGTLYSGTVTLGATETLKAIAYKSGMTDSSVASALYTINLPVATPTFSPVAGTYTNAQTVTISTTTSGASIRYTTDGSTPSETAGTLYSGAVTVGSTETLTAIAYQTGITDSAVTSAAYTIPVSVSVTPLTATLTAGQTQQFTSTVANVANGGSTAVTWSILPAGIGTVTLAGLYTAPPCITAQQPVSVIATSVADSSKSTSVTVTLLPAPPGYGYFRTVIIDHTKVPNTDQANFPFLFSITDPAFATTTNGGHVTSANGYDLIFTSDPGGAVKLDHELEQYNPVTGQVAAWVRIPTLSHTGDTTLYVFYGNSAITTDQSNRTGVWDSNFRGVWHFSNATTVSTQDATANANNGTINGVPSVISGEIGWAANFGGSNDNLAIHRIPLSGADYTISAWFKTPLPVTGSWNTLTRGSAADHQVIVAEGNWHLGAYYGGFRDSGFAVTSLANGWHYLVSATTGSTTRYFIDGTLVGTIPSRSNDDISFLGNYQGNGQQFGGTDELRISSGLARSADWVATEYNNQRSPNTFYTILPESTSFFVSPSTTTLGASLTQQFSATFVNNCSSGATWSLTPTGVGTITTGGLYTAPATISSLQTVTVTATSVADSTKTAVAVVTLAPPVSVSPSSITLFSNQTKQFTAIVGLSNPAVTWAINPSTVGSISTSGLYTAPSCVTTQQTVTVTATSVADTTKSAFSIVTLQGGSPFSYHRAVIIDHTKVPNTDQTNFPLLFSVTNPSFATTPNGGHVTNANGFDIIFSFDPSGTVKLDHELEQYNPITGQVTAWVRIPALSHANNTILYVFYGNSAITTDQSNRTGVWDSNFKEVLHLDESAGSTVFDSTTNSNSGSKVSAISPAFTSTGFVGAAQNFNGTSDYIALPAPMTTGLAAFSVGFWTKTSDNGSNGTYWNRPQFVGDSTNGNASGDFGINSNSGLLAMWSGLNSGGDNSLITSNLVSDNNWHHIVATNDGSTIRLYMDGGLTAQTLSSGLGNDNFGWYLGAQHYYAGGAAFYHQGIIDEFRFSNSARSADWIATEFNNESSPSTFYTINPENAPVNIAPLVSYLYAAQTEQLTAVGSSCVSSTFTWSIPSNALGTITAGGLYTAPASITSAQAVIATATNPADNTTGTATVNLLPPIGVSISPLTVTLPVGQIQQFTATLTNGISNAVTWTVTTSNGGSITAAGIYTAPSTVPSAETVTITATSVTDPTKSATANVLVLPIASAPMFGPAPGIYGFSPSVTISSASSSASIRYTTDGSTPTEIAGTLYTAPIPISVATTIKAIAYGSGLADSPVTSGAYSFATATSTARFQFVDPATEGSWQGVYGKDGYNVIGGTAAYPGYVTVTGGVSPYIWNSTTSDQRAPESASTGTNRVAGTWAGTAFNIDLHFSDTAQHQVGLYLLDWDNLRRGDSIIVVDAATNAILDVRNASSFANGQYWVWTLSGHVILQITQTGAANAVISGLFFDPPGVTVSPTTVAVAPNQTQQFNAVVTNSTNPAVTWSVSPSLGSISSTGLYTGPASLPTEQTVTVTATSVADSTKSGSATVTLLPGVTGGAGGTDISLIAASLCRHPHVGPTVSAGGDQDPFISCSGSSCTPVSVNVQGAALTYTLVPGFALTYSWSLVSGPAPVQFSNPTSPSSTVTITAAGNYTLQFDVNDGISTGSAFMHVYASSHSNGNGEVYLTPSVSGPNAVNKPVSLQATWRHSDFGLIIAGGTIQVTVTGANPQTATIVTDGNGTAVFTYTGVNPGTDTIVPVGQSGNLNGNVTGDSATVTWVTQPMKLTSSPVTGQFFPADGSGSFNLTPAQTPVFTQVFPAIDFDPAAGTVPGNTSGVTNQTRPFTDIVTDRTGNYVGAIVAQGDAYQAGVGPLYNFGAVFTGTLNVPAAGQVTFTITGDDAFIFGMGNSATRVNGPQTNTPTTSPFNNYPVMGGVNQRSAPAASTITVNFPAAGAYPYELDYAKGGDNKLTLTLLATGAPIPAAALLTLTPATAPSITAGQVQQVTLTATDADGVVLTNLPVAFSVTGTNAQTRLLTTNGVGQVDFAYVGEQFLTGVDTVQAAAHISGADAYSNAVVVTWNSGTNQAPVVSAGSNQTVNLPGQAILTGSVTDDGLPNNTLTVTWSMQSGPAAVVFDNPSQAATAATFSATGTYVLLLTASDGTLTSTSTVTISVNAATTWNTGWIANPINESSVSGQVPVTLIPGITLTSGTLTFYPANNQSAITTISATTTGTGQIGIFDTTLLNNGSYFVELRATNSAAVTQDNLVLVTVVGNYKPGRVTATVTDFTVPSAGLSIQVQRTYDSLLKSQSSDFGFGWQLGLNAVNMTTSVSADVTLTVGGQRHTFYFTPQASFIPGVYSPQFTAEPGFYGSLSGQNDNCSGLLLHVGNIFECYLNNGGQSYQPQTYTYTDPYGRVYTLSPTGALQSLKDLNGNTLTLAATGITSSTGLNIPFLRDTQGRITQITDATGNLYKYAYDTNGNLLTVTLPPTTNPTATHITTYGYDSTHLLTSEQDPDPLHQPATTVYYPNGQLHSITDSAGQTTSYVYNVAANTTTVTNPDGGTVTTVTDAYGMPLTVTDALGRTTINTYDPTTHNLLTATDPLGKVTTYTYDSNGFRTSLKDPLNNIWGATYNSVGGPLTVTNPLNQTQTVTYDTSYRISTITDTIGSVAGFTYNTQGLPLTLQDARGNTSHYAYDAYGNRTGYTDPLTRTTTSVFNNSGWMTSQTDPRTHQTQYGYDSLGRKTSTTDANGKITQYAYDANNNKISETDALNRTTAYIYDNVNRMTGITYPDTTTKSFTYDFRGNKLTETDQLGRVTKNVYDLAGQLTSVTVAFGTADAATTSYTYDLDGRKLTQTDPRGNTTTYTYDDAGRMTSVKDAANNLTQYGYDFKGQRTSMTDAKNRVTNYTYDSRGRQLTTTTPDTKTVTKTYDGLGLVLTTQDEENRTTTFGYDAASQLTSVTDALSQITHYTYDPAGNKLTQVDANNHTTSYAWDNLNRRTSRTLPASQVEQFTYDDVGNMATRVDFNGKTTTYAYDSLNRLLSRTPDASFSALPISFTYTSTGQRLTMTDPSGTTTYTYTNRDQVATKATPQGTLTYNYDLAGNVASTLSSNANGTSVTYAWDANNRLSSVTDSRLAGATTTYTYDATNQLSTMTYPNSVVHSYGYDTRDRVLTLNGYTQTFSPSGRKQSVTETSGRAANYGYDNIYRLLNETISGDPTSANNGALTYVLDPVGNRQSLTSTLAALQAQSFTYDADDRNSGDTFDANGNTLTSGGVAYTYDFEDRLLTTSSGLTIVYDGDGNRVFETATGTTTKYLVDDQTPTGYPQITEELVGGAVTAQFTYGPMRISQRRTATSYYGYDAGGSVRQLFDNTGAVTDTYAYDAFGNTVAQTGTTVNEFQYRGEQYDASLQMYYLRARFYVPRKGRFLTADKYEQPCGSSRIGEGDYAYGADDPVDRIDPDGENSFLETAIIEEDPVDKILRGAVLLAISASAVCVVELVGSILGNEVAGFLGGFDFTLERASGLNCYFNAKNKRKKSGKKTCEYKCTFHVNGMPAHGNDGEFYTGEGSGKDCPTACAAALADMNSKVPLGGHAQHCPVYARCR